MRWVLIVVLASVPAVADRSVNLSALEPPTDAAEYRTWLAAQSRAVRAAIGRNCADGYSWDPLCNGIGPYGLDDPPPRSEVEERAAWEASLTAEQVRYVASACAGPRHLMSTLCGYSLPSPPKAGEPFGAWRAALSRNERGMVDEHCAEMDVGTDEYCDGIGPLHLPVPPVDDSFRPGGTTGKFQTEWDAWYRSLTKAQRVYYRHHCEGANAGVSQLCGGTPLVVVLDGKPVEFTRARDESRFAIDGVAALRTDWPTARTPWIARDLDGNGVISDGGELFGSGTVLPDGRRAADGFEALAALDDNGDGVIDVHDRAFAELLLWSDRDGDRRGTGNEVVPLAGSIESISLDHVHGGRCDRRGNCERLRSSAVARGAEGARRPGEVVDVQLLVQPPSPGAHIPP
jgi:hypothetical protein